MASIDRLWAELAQLRVELRRISTQQIRSELTGAQTDINALESDVAALKAKAHPLGVLGYAEVTSNQLNITTETDVTGLSVAVIVETGRRIRVTGHMLIRQDGGAGQPLGLIYEDTSSVQRFLQHSLQVDEAVVIEGSVILTPTSGSHTYKLTLQTSANDVDMLAGATYPAFILVEDVGPV